MKKYLIKRTFRFIQKPWRLRKRTRTISSFATTVLLLSVGVERSHAQTGATNSPPGAGSTSNATQTEASVELSPSQLNAIKVAPVGMHAFPDEREAVGSIAFVDDLNVQVFPPYQGKLLKTFVELGDAVEKGQTLYTIDSPDLIQAQSTLISAEGTFELTSRELARAKGLYGTNGVSEREVEQATSDQQTAEGALKAARDAVRVFGKTDTEIAQIVATRKIDPALVVRSPVKGEVTAFNAPPGLLVQPGTGTAPLSVTDTSIKWMLANVVESDSPFFNAGQPVQAKVMAFPGRLFQGKVSKIYATVDPGTHRVTVRSEIADPNRELRPGMLATFVIQIRDPVQSVAIPTEGVVRNGDGTMAAWVTTDQRRFVQRIIKVGLQRDGQDQVLEGLHSGELAVTEGAVFLSNMFEAPPTD